MPQVSETKSNPKIRGTLYISVFYFMLYYTSFSLKSQGDIRHLLMQNMF